MLDKIIISCKNVVKNSEKVKINKVKLDEFINEIKTISFNKVLRLLEEMITHAFDNNGALFDYESSTE